MSKIFDAARHGDGQLSKRILSSVFGEAVGQNGPAREENSKVGVLPLVLDAKSTREASEPEQYQMARLSPPAIGPLVFFHDKHLATEQYRIARTKIAQHVAKPRVVLVSSAASGDGKTTTAINLATALSLNSDGDILLIDGDFRRPMVASQLGLAAGLGISEVLSGVCPLHNAIRRTEQFPSLCILTAGEVKDNPAEMLDSAEWKTLCSGVRKTFRFVVFDSPPISAVADYDLLQAVSDSVVLTATPDRTPRKLLLKALQTIPKEKFIGVILNRVPKWFLWNPHGHEYYKYYSGLR